MRTHFLALAVALSGGVASAAPRGVIMADVAPDLATEQAHDLRLALQQQMIDVKRVHALDLEVVAAERELATAKTDAETTAALARVQRQRHARDLAIGELERSTAAVRRADARASRVRSSDAG